MTKNIYCKMLLEKRGRNTASGPGGYCRICIKIVNYSTTAGWLSLRVAKMSLAGWLSDEAALYDVLYRLSSKIELSTMNCGHTETSLQYIQATSL